MKGRIFSASFLSAFISSAILCTVFFFTYFPFDNASGADVRIFIFRFIFLSLIVSSLFAAIFSYAVSQRISKAINLLDPDHIPSEESFEELSPLISKLAARKRSYDRALRESERKAEEFRLITENMSEGLLTIDEAGTILNHNNAALRFLGKEITIGRNILDINRAPEFREVIFSALDGKRAENEIILLSRTYELIANPVFDKDKTIGAIIIFLDVTELRKQEQLRREFTSNVSHELKTPLTSISGFAEIMKSGETDSETVSDFSSSIYDEAQRLISLVSDIIKLSELDEGSIEFERENVDLFFLSEEILGRMLPSAEKKSISLSLHGESAVVFGTRKILDEMIYNLCDNAIKYNNDGGNVCIEVTPKDDEILLRVTDDGIGIPESDKDRIFERFYRVDKSHSREIGGTGLGLSIVKHGAIFHDAKIALESELGRGTAISLIFKKSI